MSWSDLPFAARAGIVAAGFLLVVVLFWTFLIAPLGPRMADLDRRIQQAESRLAGMEGEISSTPPASQAERAAWQATADELYSRLGPKDDLALFVESMVSLSEDHDVELYLTTADSVDLRGGDDTGATGAPQVDRQEEQDTVPSRAMRVLGDLGRTVYVPLNARIYGEFAPTGEYIADLSRLDRVVEVVSVRMGRSFPDVLTEMQLRVYFRSPEAQGAEQASRRGIAPPGGTDGGDQDGGERAGGPDRGTESGG